MLDKLNIPAPRLPPLYNQCSSVGELATSLERRDGCATRSGIDWRAELLQRSGPDALAPYLINKSADIAAETQDGAQLTTWLQLLTPYTGCMSRSRPQRQQVDAAASTSSENDSSSHSPAARQRDASESADNSRCVLRLDFASPLVCLCVASYISPQTDGISTAAAPPSTRRPLAAVSVSSYRHRLIAVRVSGFAIGPTDYDPTGCFSRVNELHGNWQRLRQWLLTAAPHCTPDQAPLTYSSGVGAVDFVLEETHRHELQALHGMVVPEAGITRPLNLTVSVRRQSPDVACSTCGQAGHRARGCPSRPTDGARTCKTCFATGHATTHCPTAPDSRKCGLCGNNGHATLQCHKYKPRWVDVAQQSSQAPRQRSTFASDRVALLRGKAPTQPQPTSQPQRQQPRLPAGATDFPPLPGPTAGGGAAPVAWPAARQRLTSDSPAPGPRPASDSPATLALEQAVLRLTTQMETMQQLMVEAQRQAAKQMELMQAVLMRLLDTGAPHPQQLYKPATSGHYGGYGAPPLIDGPSLTATIAPAFNLQPAQPQSTGALSPAAASAPTTGTQPGVAHHPVLNTSTYHVQTPLIFGSLGSQYFASPAHAPPASTATHQATERPSHPPAYGSHPAPTNVLPNEQ